MWGGDGKAVDKNCKTCTKGIVSVCHTNKPCRNYSEWNPIEITKLPYQEPGNYETPFIRRGVKNVTAPMIDSNMSNSAVKKRWMPDLDYLDKHDK